MCELMQNLEPIRYERNFILVDEMDELLEVIIITRGQTNIGFRVNTDRRMALKYDQDIIGDYFITFNKRSIWVYQTHTSCSGYFIRKQAWFEIINNDDHKDVREALEPKLTAKFLKTKNEFMKIKKKHLEKIAERADYDAVISMTFVNIEEKERIQNSVKYLEYQEKEKFQLQMGIGTWDRP